MRELKKYLKNMVDGDAEVEGWDARQCLNLQLAGIYEYYLVTVLNEHFLLIKPQESIVILKIKIHIARIREKSGYEVALLLERPTAYMLKKLLEERIAFVCTNNQLYLPFMALHMKKNYDYDVQMRETFAPATQMVFLFILYSDKNQFCLDDISRRIGISAMTASRAMEHLERIGVVSATISGKTGRKKIYCPLAKNEFYSIGKEFLINPVRKNIYVREIPNGVKVYKGGMTALAEQTMLGEPQNNVYATSERQSVFSECRVPETQALSEGMPEIQFMKYDIGKLAAGSYVDPITLIMSIKDKDDRTEIAIDELMEGTEWYVG